MAAATRSLAKVCIQTSSKVRGFVPFYKEAGVSHRNVRDWLKLHLENECGVRMKSCGIIYRVAKCPETPFSGICFLLLGTTHCEHSKYFQDVDTTHTVTLKLGTSTNTGVLMPGVLSTISNTSDTSHVTQDDIFMMLKRQLDYKEFMLYDSYMPLDYESMHHVIDPHAWWENDSEGKSRDSFLRWMSSCTDVSDQERIRQQRMLEQPFLTRFRQLTILSYDPPFLRLNIEANGRFSPRSFAPLFHSVSGIDCCVIHSDRVVFGPVQKQDCLHKHQMYLKELQEAAEQWSQPLMHLIWPSKLRNEIKVEKRLRF